MHVKRGIILLVFLLGAQWGMSRTLVDYGPKWTAPTDEYVTPHIAWLKPNANGPMRVLFITARGTLREIVELRQRMDIKATVFAMDMIETFYETREGMYFPGHPNQEEMQKDLLAKLDGTFDLIVLGPINWSALPMEGRYRILKKIKEGTPLLGMPHGADEYLPRATQKKTAVEIGPILLPCKGLPAFSKYENVNELIRSTVEVSQFGKGRIFLLKGYPVGPAQLLTPDAGGNPLTLKQVEYDYYLAYLAHLLLAVAGKRPDITLGGSDAVMRNRTDSAPLEFIVKGPAGRTVECRFVLRNTDNKVLREQTGKCKLVPDGNQVRFQIGTVPGGNYFADLWVKAHGKSVTFGSVYVTVTSAKAIAGIEVNPVWRQKDAVTGTVTVTNTATDWAGTFINVIRRDNYGRVTGRVRTVLDKTAGNSIAVPFVFPATPVLSVIQYVDAELWDGQGLAQKSTAVCSVSDVAPNDDLRYLIWASPPLTHERSWDAHRPSGYLDQAYFDILARAGCDIQYTQFSETAVLANMRHMGMVGGGMFYGASLDAEHPHIRSVCPHNPEQMKGHEANLKKNIEQTKAFSTTEYNMGDETYFSHGNQEECFCPFCIKAFHEFLKEEYGSLENLNREYQTNAISFEEIKPVTLEEALKDTRLAPLWVDYRRHMESTWAGLFRHTSEVARSIVPGAKVGYEGSDTEINSLRAADFYKLMKAMQINGIYDGAFVPMAVMDFSDPGTLLGLGWYGGYHETRCSEFHRYVVWRQLFRGANSFWVWHTAPGTFGGSVMAPDFSFFDFFKANIREVGEIKSGSGKLLMTAKRSDDRTAILYSASSVHASALTRGLPGSEAVLNALVTMMEDSGSQFRIVSYQQVADGILRSGGFRYLVLPYAQALSAREIGAIETFVREGGIVIADLRPGVCDEHGKALPEGGLDQIFGVKQATAGPQPFRAQVTVKEPGFPGTLPVAAADASLKLTTGTARGAVGSAPAFIVKSYGKGRAILLNFSLSGYARVEGGNENSRVAAGKEAGGFGTFWKSLQTFVGMPEKVKMGSAVCNGLRLYRFECGPLEYLGILQELPESTMTYTMNQAKPLVTVPVELTLDRNVHVYDVRGAKYLGYTDTIKAPVTPGIARMYALLPYCVKKLSVEVSGRIQSGKELEYRVKLTVEGGAVGRHVVRRVLIAPDGKEASWYSENMTVENGALTGRLTLALNEQPGTWKIRFKDVASGVETERIFVVENDHAQNN